MLSFPAQQQREACLARVRHRFSDRHAAEIRRGAKDRLQGTGAASISTADARSLVLQRTAFLGLAAGELLIPSGLATIAEQVQALVRFREHSRFWRFQQRERQ